MGRFDGKCAVVTGAGGGIGESVARLFAADGGSAVCCDVDRERVQAVVSDIEAAGGQALAVEADVSDFDDMRGMVSAAVAAFGGVDVLVNNAVWRARGAVHEVDLEEWRHCLDVTLTGAMLCSKAVVPEMLRRGSGAIVNVCSTYASVAGPAFAPYHAAKGGLLMLTRSMARDLGPAIRVNAVSPGIVDTPAIRATIAAADDPAWLERDMMAANRILNRFARPDEISRAILFLVSDDASFITGIDLLVDGGQTAVGR